MLHLIESKTSEAIISQENQAELNASEDKEEGRDDNEESLEVYIHSMYMMNCG